MRAAADAARPGRFLHRLFAASLLAKGLLAALEAVAGLGLYLAPEGGIRHLADWLTRNELAQDPDDRMAVAVRGLLDSVSLQTQHFFALYLLAHGVLKLAMVLLLARRVRWAYPAALAILAGFVIYQVEHALRTHAPGLILLTALDALMFVLVVREWRLMRASRGHLEGGSPT